MLQLVPLKACEDVTVTNEEKLGVMRIKGTEKVSFVKKDYVKTV